MRPEMHSRHMHPGPPGTRRTVSQVLAPELTTGDVVIMAICQPTRCMAYGKRSKRPVRCCCICLPTRRTSTRSRWHSQSLRRCCALQPRARSMICGKPSVSPSALSSQASAKVISPPQDTTQHDRKMLYLVLRQVAGKWKMPPREWCEAKTQFAPSCSTKGSSQRDGQPDPTHRIPDTRHSTPNPPL